MISYQWYALYTRSRFEKRIAACLLEQGFEAYLPLVSTFRRWSDRMKKVNVPLFNSYVFVKTSPADQKHFFGILQIPGVVKIVCFEGKPVPIPSQQITALQRFSELGYEIQTVENAPAPGDQIEINQGIFKGLRGQVLQVGNNQSLIIYIEALDKNIRITIPAGLTIKLNS
jgi:transcription antitermination factor NusG